MGMYAEFKSDDKKEKEGVWFDFGPVQFLLAYAGGANKQYQKQFNHLTKPYKRAIDMGSLDEEKQNKVMMECFINAIILDWRNATDENDEPMEFNTENVLKVLTELPVVWDGIFKTANDQKYFRETYIDEQVKNL